MDGGGNGLAPDPVEAARRARAAVAYTDADFKELLPHVGMSERTLRRVLDGTRKATSWQELWRIADVCGLPAEWFSADFRRLHEIVSEGPVVRRPSVGGAAPPRGELGQHAQDESPTPQDRRRSDSDQDRDAQTGTDR